MAVGIYPLLARSAFATYGYFVIDEATRRGLLVDPGAQPQLYLRAIHEKGWSIEAILLTHGHFDHMGAAGALRDELDAPVMAHEESARYLADPRLNLSAEHRGEAARPSVRHRASLGPLAHPDRRTAAGGHAVSCRHIANPRRRARLRATTRKGKP